MYAVRIHGGPLHILMTEETVSHIWSMINLNFLAKINVSLFFAAIAPIGVT
jgi:hypothetical protein